MGAFSSWLGAKPHRATVVNLLMLTLLLALIGSAALFKLVGGIALLLASLYFLRRALARTLGHGGRRHLYELALLWAPGLIAVALSCVAIWLIETNVPGSLDYDLAIALFGCEIAMLVIGASEAIRVTSKLEGAL